MPDQATLDPLAILASLGVTDARQINPLTGGFDTAIWRVEWQDASYALRVFRPEQAETCKREIHAMRIAADNNISVPAIIRQGEWQERPVLLLSWVQGRTLAAELQSHPHQIRQLGRAFGRIQAAIHRIPAPADMNATSWIEWAGDEPELKQRLYDLPSRQTRLLHLDYHPLNIMADGGQISGILDWANARAGDPRADFARTFVILRVELYRPQGDDVVMMVLRRSLEHFWRAGYVQAGGQLDEMALFYAWAGASMIRDLSPRIGKEGFWLEDQHLDPVRIWRDHWKRQAGIV